MAGQGIDSTRIVGIAFDQTFSNNFPFRPRPDIPGTVRVVDNGDEHLCPVGVTERQTVEAAYYASHERLGLLGYHLYATDMCTLDADFVVIGRSHLVVEDAQGNPIGSFDGCVSVLSPPPLPNGGGPRVGALDVKYTKVYVDVKSHRSGFSFLQAAGLLCVVTGPRLLPVRSRDSALDMYHSHPAC